MNHNVRRLRAMGGVGSLVLAAVLASSSTASAQATGWALDRFDPTPAGDLFFTSDYGLRGRPDGVSVRAGILGDYAFNPLTITSTTRQPDGSTMSSSRAIVEHMLVLHAQVGMVITDRFNIHASIPFTLLEAGPQ